MIMIRLLRRIMIMLVERKKTGWLGEMGERQRQRSRSDLVHKHTFATYTQIGRDFFRHFLYTSLSGD